MRLKLAFCVAAVLALCFTTLPASAGCHGCGGGYGYTYAYPAYSYGLPVYAGRVGRCGRVFRRNCFGYRVHTVPAYTYTYAVPAFAYVRPCRRWRWRRRCW